MRFNLPNEILDIIFKYDGRIKFKYGEFVNIIDKKDTRYTIIEKIICKKIKLLKRMEISGSGFYLEVSFEIDNRVGLCYDYNFSYPGEFEICYFDIRDGWNWIQIRTYL